MSEIKNTQGGKRDGAGRKRTLTDTQVRKARSINDEEYELVLKLREDEELSFAVKSMIQNS